MNDGLVNQFLPNMSVTKQASGYLKRKIAEFHIAATNRGVPSHQERIAALLEEDKFLLIIFDACRFDTFERIYSSYFDGELQHAYTTNTYTKQYLANTWDGKHDITYVAGGPVISDRTFELSDIEYHPSEHFGKILPAWKMDFEKELGVTPPEAVTKVALENNSPRMVVHYFQPHAPYIGTNRLRIDDESTGDDQSRVEKRGESLKEIYIKIEEGEIDDETLESAYKTNLERVMEASKPLVEKTTCRTVITSDHGELLGEDDRYLHGGLPHPKLCEIPWFEIDGVIGETTDVEVEVTGNTGPEKNVKEQLQDLGYM